MCKFILNKEKQRIIKILLGEEFYNNLYWYQKWLIQTQLTDKEIEGFQKIEEHIRNGNRKVNQNNRNNKSK